MDRKHIMRLVACAMLLALCVFSVAASVDPCAVSCAEADTNCACQCVCRADPVGLPPNGLISFMSSKPRQSPTQVVPYSLLLVADIFRPPVA